MILPWVIVILAVAASILCTGIALGLMFARTNPSDERPIRTVKVRGEVVDFLA